MSRFERIKRRQRLKSHKAKMISKVSKKLKREQLRKTKNFLKNLPLEMVHTFLSQFEPYKSNPQLLQYLCSIKEGYSKIWLQLDWSGTKQDVFNKQTAIHKETRNGGNVYELQKQLIDDPKAKLLAVRRVAHDNQGKKTAGVDGVKTLSPLQKFKLAASLQLDGQSGPIRRVWIPKPGTEEKRPLGIPNMVDRAKQALAKLAIEPQWEARFEETSYGFRPARQAHDAVWRVWNSLHRSQKWVLDADLEKCFDRISHEWIIQRLGFPKGSILEKQVLAWLQAGILEEGNPFPIESERGTPQGGVISPLLANIALDGMMEAAAQGVAKIHGKQAAYKYMHIVRYADDFVVLAQEEKHIATAKAAIEEWLTQVGLNIKAAKTKILFTGEKGSSFDFLGFTFKTHVVGKHKQRKINRAAKNKHQLSICPSKKSVKNHFSKVKYTISKCSSAKDIVKKVSPIIRGWVNYISIGNARTMGKVGQWNTRLFKILSNWQKRTYGTRKRIPELWATIKRNKWRFHYMEGTQVKPLYWYDMGEYSTKGYTAVQGTKSPYDGDTVYWARRAPSYARAGDVHAKVLAKQKFKCPICNKDFFYTEEVLYHMDHKLRKASGGSNQLKNLQAIHKWCHESKTAVENSKVTKGITTALGGGPIGVP